MKTSSPFLKKRTKKLFSFRLCRQRASGLDRSGAATAKEKKFFGSFFQKRTACFTCLILLAAAAPSDAVITLTTQPGSALEATARELSASDLKQAREAGDEPLLLVGSQRLSVGPGAAALFVQVQSASFCGSAGCSTSAYVKRGGGWTKVLDSISGPIKVSRSSHKGMRDLLVHS